MKLNHLLISLIAFGLAACGNNGESRSMNGNSDTQMVSDQSEAMVQVVKYSDYQCPACGYYVAFEQRLKEELGDTVSITTKHFPLSMHAYAQVASRSAEAARKQGKYLEMHYKIFEGQPQWSKGNAEAIFIGYAEELGLDVETFKRDMNSAEMNRIVMEDRKEGRDMGVNSTPTYYINGNKVQSNPQTYPAFKALVTQYLD